MAINEVLVAFGWLSLIGKEVQKRWDIIISLYVRLTDAYIPMSSFTGGNNANQKWMTRQTAIARNAKVEKWEIYRRNRTSENFAIYARYRNDSVKAIRDA